MSYGENYITPCASCYNYTLPACPASTESITIQGTLGVTQSRVWFVEDKFGKVTMGTAITNASGHLAIPMSAFEDGYFNEFAGEFTIYVKATEAATAVIDMTLGGATYECIKLNFQNNNSTNIIIA